MADPTRIELVGDRDASWDSGSVFFVGNATTIIRYAGFTVLTDPNFLHQGARVHLGYGLTAKRRTQPAITLDELPPIDLVVLSHLHEDHFDRVVIRDLDHRLPLITTPKGADALARRGFRATRGLQTWQAQEVSKGHAQLRVVSMPGVHAPGLLRGVLPPVMGSMLEFSRGGEVEFRLYITGDTLMFDGLQDIPRRYPDIDLGLWHLGGTRVLGVTVTMDAKQGIQALETVRPREAIPIHYNDYTAFKSPLSDFKQAVQGRSLHTRVSYLAHGETYTFRTRVDADRS